MNFAIFYGVCSGIACTIMLINWAYQSRNILDFDTDGILSGFLYILISFTAGLAWPILLLGIIFVAFAKLLKKIRWKYLDYMWQKSRESNKRWLK